MVGKELYKKSWIVFIVASVVFLGGWFARKERPLLPAGAILAAHTTDATKDAPVLKQFERVVNEQLKHIPDAARNGSSEAVAKLGDRPLESYLGIDRAAVAWSLLTMGKLTPPGSGQEMLFPDVTAVLCGTFDKAKVVATLTRKLQESHPDVTLDASQLNGVPVWTVKGVALDKIRGLRPCMSFYGSRLLFIASNEKALQGLLDLYGGRVPGLSKGSALGRVLDADPNVISRLMVVDIHEMVNAMTSEAERKQMVSDPKMSAVLQSLRELMIETRLADQGSAAELVMRVECADEGSAQTLNELWITAKTSLLFIVNMGLQQQPDLKVVPEWLSKIRVGVSGKETTLSLECTPQEIQDLDVKKLMAPKIKKSGPQKR